jgi:hypothetical protein
MHNHIRRLQKIMKKQSNTSIKVEERLFVTVIVFLVTYNFGEKNYKFIGTHVSL